LVAVGVLVGLVWFGGVCWCLGGSGKGVKVSGKLL
jgi:hypothetical protein